MPESRNILVVSRAIIREDDRILTLQRSQSDTRNPGLWEFPGGKIDEGENVIDGLTREVYEETGLTIKPLSSIAHVESEIIGTGKYAGRLYVSLFYAAQRIGGDLTLSSEHGLAQWERPEQASQLRLTTESRLALASLRSAGIIKSRPLA